MRSCSLVAIPFQPQFDPTWLLNIFKRAAEAPRTSLHRIPQLQLILPWSENVLGLKLNLFTANSVLICSKTQPHSSTLQPVAIPDYVSASICFPDDDPTRSRTSFPLLTTLLPTQSSPGCTNTAYKTVLIRASTTKILSLWLQSLVPILRRSWPACSTRRPSFLSWDDPDLPALPDDHLSCPETILICLFYLIPILIIINQTTELTNHIQICLLTRHFCKIKLTFDWTLLLRVRLLIVLAVITLFLLQQSCGADILIGLTTLASWYSWPLSVGSIFCQCFHTLDHSLSLKS